MTRNYCSGCKRLQQNCLCDVITPIENAYSTLFLQHPLESSHVKNTAWLAHCCLNNSRFEIGEIFDPNLLEGWLGHQSVLLYPSTEDFDGEFISVEQFSKQTVINQLVILDGTWKKTRKMLFVNPMLASLPRIQLRPSATSQYAIRKQKNSVSLSTLEAVQQLLVQLESDPQKYQPLSIALQALVKQQLDFRSQS